MFLLTATSFTHNQAHTHYVNDDNLTVIAAAVDGAITEAKLRGSKTFSINGVILPQLKVYETVMMNPPTVFKDILIEARNNRDQMVAEMTISLMEE